MEIIKEIKKNIECLRKGKYVKGDTKYIQGDTKYIKGNTNYEYLKYILLIFILLIGGYVIISVIRDMNDITGKINKLKLTPETRSNINTNILPKKIVKEEDKEPIKKKQIQDKLKITIDKQQYIKHSQFDFCWYKVKSDDNSCYLF